jgi:hypothetical protein
MTSDPAIPESRRATNYPVADRQERRASAVAGLRKT